ncbi:DUF4381 domain-containing protein [Sedimentitalea todarodis]|uniref:DUF4381 domain-containing protein n=1 Tax=Sedimentitalea todarodis TaxID=1631240 RepID=A0ABU3VF32_9RHOB|nr:DUF4381 domain-containing protein [Sedimentitalea todarodis]MDU9004785.1 DUF4381 domain-containing protein [Sedimentitalea todarodis]
MNGDLDGLNLVQLLDRLEPAPEPLPISLMPQTVGWVWLGIGLVVALLLLIREFLRHRRANAYRRAALDALSEAGDDPARIAQIIRRTALTAYPREEVAALTGEHWLAYLDRTLPGDGFSNGPGRVLANAPYTSVVPTPGLAELARHWISGHSTARRGQRT